MRFMRLVHSKPNHMRKTFLFLALLPLFSFAQDVEIKVKPQPSHEVGVNLFSVTNLDTYLDYVDRLVTDADVNYIPGVYYKYHFGKNALRASFDYTQKFIRSGDPDAGYGGHYVAGWKKDLSIGMGYERSFGNWKLQPYVFGDAVFNYHNMTGERLEWGCFGPNGIFKFSEETLEYGMAVGTGMRYKITPRLNVSYEFAAQGFIAVFDDLYHAGPKYVDRDYRINPVNKLGLSFSF